MKQLRDLSFVFLFIFILIVELFIGIITDFSEVKILPFFVLIFYVSTKYFSNSFVIPFFLSGIYYDAFYTSNYFGTTSAKFILITIVINFINNRLRVNLYNEFILFTFSLALYKFETLFISFSINYLFNIFLISGVNYFLFKLINITLKEDVFKKSF
tara:strand:- start:1002 stop:1472 length:471 start_codon:yes stop_codon:yes gene_type:complete